MFCDDSCQKLKYSTEFRELLDSKYNSGKHLLDKDFLSQFPGKHKSRILELDVADQLVSYYNKNTNIQVSNGSLKKDIGGPDFKIVCENYNIFIECVCAQNPAKDCVEQECKIDKIECSQYNIYTKKGIDKIKIARISSVIKDKSEKIQRYKKKNIISDNDIIVLVIGTNFKNINCLPTKPEFEYTIAHKSIMEDHNTTTLVEPVNKKFKKNNKIMQVLEKELNSFNCFVHVDNYIDHKDLNKNKIFHYEMYVRELCDQYSKEIIEQIFDAKATDFNHLLYRKDSKKRFKRNIALRKRI